MKKILHALSYLTIALSLAMMVYVAYLLVRDFQPIMLYDNNGAPLEFDGESFYDLEILDDDKVLEKGLVHSYLVNYCRDTNVKAEVEKHLYDGILIEINDKDLSSGGSFSMGCHTVELPFFLSEKVPVGTYRIRVRIDYQYSPIRVVTRYFYTEQFIVTD